MKKRSFWQLLVLAVFCTGAFLWYKEGQLPVNATDQQVVIFVIPKGQSLIEISKNLEKNNLIRNRVVFFLLVKQLDLSKSIQAGSFRLNKSMTAREIANSLTHGTQDTWVTILEGWRKEEVAEALAKKNLVSELLFIDQAKEGYLFPDTYLLPLETNAEAVLKIISNNYHTKVDQSLLQKAQKKLGFDENELLTLASLIEREGKTPQNRRMIAGIFLNRLNSEMPLQVDATIQYILGYSEKEKTWWRKSLTSKDLQTESSYNTYTNLGLPPGPICNPGLDSIKAVIDATESDYLYYISDKQGVLHYAKTLEEHNKNIKKYL